MLVPVDLGHQVVLNLFYFGFSKHTQWYLHVKETLTRGLNAFYLFLIFLRRLIIIWAYCEEYNLLQMICEG